MKAVYPVLFTKVESSILVEVPDLNITTEADLFKAEIILPKLEMSEKKED